MGGVRPPYAVRVSAVLPRPGVGPSPVRLGLVVPGDCHVDDEFWRLSADGVLPLIARTTGADQASMQFNGVAHTRALAESSDLEMAADRLRAVHPHAAAYIDTSISFVRGPGGDLDIARRIQGFLECPTVVTSTAVVLACRALGAGRIGVLTVYADDINATLRTFFDAQGAAVARMEEFAAANMVAGASSQDLAAIDPLLLVDAGAALDAPDVEAVFIPCTAVRTLEAIEPLEQRIGKPVITAIQATMWAVQRLAGVAADVAGGGRLFEVALAATGEGVTR
jgi:maleate isomerase